MPSGISNLAENPNFAWDMFRQFPPHLNFRDFRATPVIAPCFHGSKPQKYAVTQCFTDDPTDYPINDLQA